MQLLMEYMKPATDTLYPIVFSMLSELVARSAHRGL